MAIGTKKVCHVAFVTKDIYKTMENWAKLLGIEVPKIWAIPAKEICPAETFGNAEEYKDCLISVIKLDNIVLEFVQPGKEPSPWKHCLETRGEGFQHIAFVVPDPEQAIQTVQDLGTEKYYHVGYYPGNTYSFYDTREALGMEINLKYDEDNSKQREELINRLNQAE